MFRTNAEIEKEIEELSNEIYNDETSLPKNDGIKVRCDLQELGKLQSILADRKEIIKMIRGKRWSSDRKGIGFKIEVNNSYFKEHNKIIDKLTADIEGEKND